jgi:hypothetical protein
MEPEHKVTSIIEYHDVYATTKVGMYLPSLCAVTTEVGMSQTLCAVATKVLPPKPAGSSYKSRYVASLCAVATKVGAS